MIKTKLGSLDILCTGSIINPLNEIITMTLGENDEITIEFEFVVNAEKEKYIEGYEAKHSDLGIRFVNFKNDIKGSGNIEPVKIGWIKGRELLLNFRIFAINNLKGVSFEYTWLLGVKKDSENED